MRKKLIVFASAKCTNVNASTFLALQPSTTALSTGGENERKNEQTAERTNERINECVLRYMNKKRDLSIECCTWIYVSESLLYTHSAPSPSPNGCMPVHMLFHSIQSEEKRIQFWHVIISQCGGEQIDWTKLSLFVPIVVRPVNIPHNLAAFTQ